MTSSPATTAGDQVGARRVASQLAGGDRGGNRRDAGVQDRGIVRVVVVARVRHAAVEPGRVMRGKLAAEHPHVGLRRAAPALHQVAELGDRRRRGSGQRAGERVQDVRLRRVDHDGVERAHVDGRRE